MDEEGYVPMALLSSYPNISCYGATIEDLVGKLSQKEDSILEVDVTNETVRLREGWEKVQTHTSYSQFLQKFSVTLLHLPNTFPALICLCNCVFSY
jgi:hypothetical protein